MVTSAQDNEFFDMTDFLFFIVASGIGVFAFFLWWGGPSEYAFSLLMFAILVYGAGDLCHACSNRAANKKTIHFSMVGTKAVLVGYAAWELLDGYPWLVCGMMSLCLFFHGYARLRLFRFTRTIIPLKFSTEATIGICIAIVVAMFIVAQTASAWLLAPGFAFLIAFHGWTVWHSLSNSPLAHDQHADIWPRVMQYATSEKETDALWYLIKYYCAIDKSSTIPTSVFQAMLMNMDAPTLLRYFHGESASIFDNIALLDVCVERRLCDIDPDACVLFNMHGDDKTQAVMQLEHMHAGHRNTIDALVLPDLQWQTL